MEFCDLVLTVGLNRDANSLSEALSMIPVGTKRVLIQIRTDIQQDTDASIPIDRGIQYVRIASFDHIYRKIDFIGCRFFANGVPLEIDATIYLKDCFLFGGSLSDNGKIVNLAASHIILKGKTDYLFGGGYAIGSGSISTVQSVSIDVNSGKVSNLYGGGYGVHQGIVNSDRINFVVNADASVTGVLYGGCYLSGPESRGGIREINLYLSGKIEGDVSLSGFAGYGSSIRIIEIIRLNAAEAKFTGNIFDKHTVGSMSSVSVTKVTGFLSKEYQDHLHVPYSNIQIIHPKPKPEVSLPAERKEKDIDTTNADVTATIPQKRIGEKNPITEPNSVVIASSITKMEPVTAGIDQKQNEKGQANQQGNDKPIYTAPVENAYDQLLRKSLSVEVPKQSKKKERLILFILIATVLLSIGLLRGFSSKSDSRANRITPTLSLGSTSRQKKTDVLTKKTMTPTVTKLASTSTQEILSFENEIVHFTTTEITRNESVPEKTSIPTKLVHTSTLSVTDTTIPVTTDSTPVIKPTDTQQLVDSVTLTPLPLLIQPDLIKETETPTSAPRYGVIQVGIDSGTYFYSNPYNSQENVIRWLNNGTIIEIMSDPVTRNNFEWYQVYCEQYNQTGWVICNSVTMNVE